jgi:hypothetical protein
MARWSATAARAGFMEKRRRAGVCSGYTRNKGRERRWGFL